MDLVEFDRAFKPASGHEHVDMRMQVQFLPPGVQDGDYAGGAAKVLLPGRDRLHGTGRALHQKPEELLRIGKEKRVQLMWDGHDDVEVGNAVDQLGTACLDPLLWLRPLAGGAVAVPAGCIVDLLIAALRTDAFCESKAPGLALHDALGRAFLFRCDLMSFAVRGVKHPECLTDEIIRH